jgi:hypothetical protein
MGVGDRAKEKKIGVPRGAVKLPFYDVDMLLETD